jgi:hypothetical protein
MHRRYDLSFATRDPARVARRRKIGQRDRTLVGSSHFCSGAMENRFHFLLSSAHKFLRVQPRVTHIFTATL